MDSALLGPTLLALVGIALVFGFIVSRIDRLALFAPKSTKGIGGPATLFCAGPCRTADGRCPLTGSVERAKDCPLWRFVDADVATTLHGNPFEPVQSS